MKYFVKLLFLFILSSIVISCSDSSAADSFDAPQDAIVVKTDTQCGKLDKSFAVFVTDNASDGSIIKKIDGCEEKVDTTFKDDKTSSTGISFDGFLSSMAYYKEKSGYTLAVVSTGKVSLKCSDNKTKNSIGRLILAKFDKNLEFLGHDKGVLYNCLDFIPQKVVNFDENFLVWGENSKKKESLILSDRKGQTLISSEKDDFFKTVFCEKNQCLALTNTNELKIINKDLSLSEFEAVDKNGDVLKNIFNINKSGKNFFIWNKKKLLVLDEDFLVVSEILFPQPFYDTTAISFADFPDNVSFLLLKESELFEKMEFDVDKKELKTKPKEKLKTIKTKDDKIISIINANGDILFYDMTQKGWLVDKTSDENYPSLSDFSKLIHTYGSTTKKNAPTIKKLSVIRGLPYSLNIKMVYGDLLYNSKLKDGKLDEKTAIFTDQTVDFNQIVKVGDFIVLTGLRNSDCLISPSKSVRFKIKEIKDEHSLVLEDSKLFSEVSKCFSSPLDYAVLPTGDYVLSGYFNSNEDLNFLKTATEISAKETIKDTTNSFSNSFFELLIQRTTDDISTEYGTSFSFEFEPGVKYFTLSSLPFPTKITDNGLGGAVVFSRGQQMVSIFSYTDSSDYKSFK